MKGMQIVPREPPFPGIVATATGSRRPSRNPNTVRGNGRPIMRRIEAAGRLAFASKVAASRPATLALAAVLMAGLVAAALLRVGKENRHGSTPPKAILPNVPYAVAVHSERAIFDLGFAAKTRYLVIVGSLGPSEGHFFVDCSSHRVPAFDDGSGDRIFPLANSRPVAASTPKVAKNQAIAGLPNAQPDRLRQVIPVGLAASAQSSSPGTIASGSRSFSLHVTDGILEDPAQYATIHAKTIAEGRQVRVYLDEQQSPTNLAPGLVREIVDLFDGDIIPRFRGLLGTYRDVDHDGRFAVLLSPWLSHLQGGRTSLGGFVRGSDFQTCLGRPFSNRCDMMYVNSQTLPGPRLRTLLIHEYAHAVCFSRRTADPSGRPRFPDEEDWLNEAIAHCAESLLEAGWSNLDYRIARFLNDTSAFPLVVGDYYRAGLWRCHGCRGATYLFLRYCLEQFGPQTLTKLIANPEHGAHNLELATGCSFEQLFRGWTLSLADVASRESAAERSGSALAPLDLHGSLGAWGLAGPRRQHWDIDSGSRKISLRGTSALYLELAAAGSSGPRELWLQGSPGSALQVSVIRLEDDAPRIEVEAALADSCNADAVTNGPHAVTNGRAAGPCLHTLVRFPQSDDLKIERISAEQNSAEIHASICFPRAALCEREVRPRPTSALAFQAFDLPAASLSARDVPIVVKVLARDRRGQRAVAWAEVVPHVPPQPERLAQRAR